MWSNFQECPASILLSVLSIVEVILFYVKLFAVHHVKLTAMVEMFDCHGYQESCDTVIGCEELQDLLTSVYQSADHSANVTIQQAEILAQLLQNLILNLFDL